MPATPSAATTSGNNDDPVDVLVKNLSILILPSSSAVDLPVIMKEFLSPCLDLYSICTLAMVHSDPHSILSTQILMRAISNYLS
jgi:hypothetical protein